MLRAVIFDLDGTLVDAQTAADEAITRWCAARGIVGDGLAERWDEIATRQYARWQRREITFAEQRRERLREFLGEAHEDQEADALNSEYLALYEAGWAAFDDALPALETARATGLRIAVLTNGEETQQQRKLERVGLAGTFDVLVASSSLPAGKPDPSAFLATLERLGVAPGEALMVGDGLVNDIRGAAAVGIRAVLVDRLDAHREAPVERIGSLDELDYGLIATPPRPAVAPNRCMEAADRGKGRETCLELSVSSGGSRQAPAAAPATRPRVASSRRSARR